MEGRKRSFQESSSYMQPEDTTSRTSLFGSFKKSRSWNNRDSSLFANAPILPVDHPTRTETFVTRVRNASSDKLRMDSSLNPTRKQKPRSEESADVSHNSLASSRFSLPRISRSRLSSNSIFANGSSDYNLNTHGFTVIGTKTLGIRAAAKPKGPDVTQLKLTLLQNYREQLAEKERLLNTQIDEEEAEEERRRSESKAGTLPPLSQEQVDRIHRYFEAAKQTPYKTVVDAFKIESKYSDLATLKPRTWLNDNVIDMFLGTVTSKVPEKAFAFTTHFFTRLDADGYPAVKRWALRKKSNVFKQDYVFVPVNRGNMHWTLAVINNRNKRLEFYDSSPSGCGERELDVLLGYLKNEAKRLNTPLPDYELVPFADGPTQTNGSDCGVFVCETVRRLTEDLSLKYEQKVMPEVRLQMANTLIGSNANAKL